MATDRPPYKRLTRSRLGFDGFGSLWLGNDHLLLAKNVFSVENYRRWYYAEIQAVIARRTATRLVLNIVYCSVGGLVGLGAAGIAALAASDESETGSVVLYVMAAIVGAFALAIFLGALVNTLLGPTCHVFIQTPHGIERISTPIRIATYEKVVARLREVSPASPNAGPSAGDIREVAAAIDSLT